MLEIEGTKIELVTGDITTQAVDAVVNAANSGLMGGGGVDGAIHRAGGPAILEECRRIVAGKGRLPVGEAVITTAGNMPSKYVIHTVGPVWRGGSAGEPELLANAYINSLRLAREYGLKNVAFPAISTGVYGYPAALAAEVALKAVAGYLKENPGVFEVIRFVLFGEETYGDFDRALAMINMAGLKKE